MRHCYQELVDEGVEWVQCPCSRWLREDCILDVGINNVVLFTSQNMNKVARVYFKHQVLLITLVPIPPVAAD